jgi:hypothetical protein
MTAPWPTQGRLRKHPAMRHLLNDVAEGREPGRRNHRPGPDHQAADHVVSQETKRKAGSTKALPN